MAGSYGFRVSGWQLWTLVDRSRSRKIIPTRFVLIVRRDAMGQVDRFTARYVVKGFLQVEGFELNETFELQ